MLQPLQLQDVSARYPNQIADLRDFLHKAGVVTATGQSLPAIVHRLQHDRAFHRDLTSHLWVVIHLAHRTISFADLLGLLALAAAGQHFAAQAQEEDAHALLLFVLEARRALDLGATQPTAPAPQSAQPVLFREETLREQEPREQAVRERAPRREEPRAEKSHPWETRPAPIQFDSNDLEQPDRSRMPLLWIALACLLIALSLGLFFHFRTTPSQPAATTPEANPATVANEATPLPAVIAPEPATPEETIPHPASSRERPFRKQPATRPPEPYRALALPVPAVVIRSNPLPPTPRPSPPITASAFPKPTPTPPPPAEPDRTNIARTYQPPRLVRRTPEQRAELNPGTLNTTVHATTLGASASSVLYSPVPAYPPAAASAHVQGEVRVQANVDRQGNVSSVRVISGPPLLREAALDAAQRWRFRPTSESGEPTTTSAITVFAFQLP